MAQFFTFTPKRKEDGAIDFYTLMDVFDERKEDGTTSPAGHGERKIKFNDMKVLIATEKPFAKKAVDGIKKIITDAGYEVALLEKYTDKAQLLAAVADANALIIRSDKVTAEVIEAAKNLKIVVRDANVRFFHLRLQSQQFILHLHTNQRIERRESLIH